VEDETKEESQQPQTFEDLGVSDALRASVEALGWEQPTPIQVKSIPTGLAGSDLVGIAQTGTGKTGAFMLPSLERIETGKGLQVLVLCPTRELAQQVCDDSEALAKGTRVRAASIYGGVGYDPQLKALKEGFEVITATPGRFLDHLGRGRVDLKNVHTFVLDEADRMLDMGFRPQIEGVLRELPRKRQTMLFSATMPHGVHDLASRITKDAVWVEAAPSGTKAEGITELVYSVKPEMKPDLLLRLLESPEWEQVLIFTRTKAGADALKTRLDREGIRTEALHSNLRMAHRTRALERFAEKKVRVLVATDIAQRGLDVDGISHVVNYDVPKDPEDYTHRIGRTARAGALGTAVTFLAAADLGAFKSMTYHIGRDLERIHLPDFDYAGTPQAVSSASPTRGRHSRSPTGMGSRDADDLTDEELADLLKH
jgi:ATP-dependent RNA helicase RhlE|tara:strand:+ start:433 stop:1713 length:1281 start_codon:yes stop_codon:yes gene_type:complete